MPRKDINQTAFAVLQQATGEVVPKVSGKNEAAVALGKLGGFKGGKARALKLTEQRRSEIASIAATARWKSKGG